MPIDTGHFPLIWQPPSSYENAPQEQHKLAAPLAPVPHANPQILVRTRMIIVNDTVALWILLNNLAI